MNLNEADMMFHYNQYLVLFRAIVRLLKHQQKNGGDAMPRMMCARVYAGKDGSN
jgi:hypothetical protein